jgi:hypothetical protein
MWSCPAGHAGPQGGGGGEAGERAGRGAGPLARRTHGAATSRLLAQRARDLAVPAVPLLTSAARRRPRARALASRSCNNANPRCAAARTQALPLGAMISKLKRAGMLADVTAGGEARDKCVRSGGGGCPGRGLCLGEQMVPC